MILVSNELFQCLSCEKIFYCFGFYKLKLSFNITGPEKEFYAFFGRCFENKQNKLRTFCCTSLFGSLTLLYRLSNKLLQ